MNKLKWIVCEKELLSVLCFGVDLSEIIFFLSNPM